jgi:hypothetical protein
MGTSGPPYDQTPPSSVADEADNVDADPTEIELADKDLLWYFQSR